MSTSAPLKVVPPFVAAALGESVIYEEYRGDFAQARLVAEEQLLQARRAGDPTRLADALLARGVVHVLQGEPPAALACFQAIDEIAPADFDRRLRAMSYARLATIWQYNLFPGGNGASSVELAAHWDGVAYTEAENPQQQAMFGQARTTLARFESFLVHSFLCRLQSVRSIVQSGRSNTSPQMIQQLLATAVQTALGFHQTAETYNAAPGLMAFADLAAADLCRRAGNFEAARTFLARAAQIYQQSEDGIGQGDCLLTLGDWWAAPFSSPAVWNFALQEGSSAGNDLAWTTEASEFGQQGADRDQAAAAYTEAEQLFSAAGAPRGLAQVLLRRCYLAMLAEDYAAAVASALQAQNACDQCGDRLAYWLSQTHRVLSRLGAGDYPEESATAEKIGTWGATEGSFSYALGLGLIFCRAARHWLIRKGDYECSLACSRLAATTFKALGATVNLAQSLADQGAVYQALGEVKTAITFYAQALDRFEDAVAGRPQLGATLHPHRVMLAVNLFGLFQSDMDADGMERTAKRLCSLIEQSAQTGGLPTDMAQMLARHFPDGSSAPSTENFDLALAALQTYALENLARSLINDANIQVPLYRAVAARDAGDPTRAAPLFAEALRAAELVDPAQRDLQKAVILAHQKAYNEAKEAFKHYLAQGGANAGFIGQLASVLQGAGGEQGRHEVARQQVRTHDQAFTTFVRLKAFAEAKVHLAALVQLAGTDWWSNSDHPWQDLSNCAELYEGLNELDQALVFYDQAIAVLEARRSRLSREELKTALAASSGVQYLYFQSARTALKQAEQTDDRITASAWAARALAYMERGKARSLLDLMASSVMVAGSSDSESAPLRAWRSVNAQLALWRGLLARESTRPDAEAQRVAQLSQQVEGMEVQLHTIEDGLAKADPAFHRQLSVQAEVLTLDQMQAALPAQTALLEYAFLGDDLLVWAVTAQGIIMKQRLASDAKALGREVRTYQGLCMDPDSQVKAIDDLGTVLARQLLNPMADAIRACSHLMIVPYGAAYTLPFHTLPWAGEPLIASHTISYLPSASALQFVRPGGWPNLPERLLAVGNPKAMTHRPPLGSETVSLPALRGAEDEANYIASLFSEGYALPGDDATKSNVSELLGRYPILHFATHGLLSEDAPLLSAILLADGEAISVYELMGLHLDADLVVLSACRTALGEITRGNEVIGLTRGLLGTGARAAVVSLWPVNDVSTSLLMGEFYRQLRTSRSPTLALQAAQNYLRQLTAAQIKAEVGKLRDAGYARDAARTGVTKPALDYQHPHFWAPFVLIG